MENFRFLNLKPGGACDAVIHALKERMLRGHVWQ